LKPAKLDQTKNKLPLACGSVRSAGTGGFLISLERREI